MHNQTSLIFDLFLITLNIIHMYMHMHTHFMWAQVTGLEGNNQFRRMIWYAVWIRLQQQTVTAIKI